GIAGRPRRRTEGLSEFRYERGRYGRGVKALPNYCAKRGADSVLRFSATMAESNNNELIGFIAGRFEAMADRLDKLSERMATREDLARLDGRLNERLEVATTWIRGDIEQVHFRLNTIEHLIEGRFEQIEGELSRLRSAVY